MMLSIANPSQEDLYDYVDQNIVPVAGTAFHRGPGGIRWAVPPSISKLNSMSDDDGAVQCDDEQIIKSAMAAVRSVLSVRRCCGVRQPGLSVSTSATASMTPG
ncbi:MAG: hypothetical protein ACLTF6_06615 [Clostridium sp.]